jgi:hypothetical protein
MALFSAFAPLSDVVAIDDKGEGDTHDAGVDSRWAVYRAAEETRGETRVATSTSSQAPLSLASVVESLVDARSDLAVIIDIATVLADQQHLGVSHVPQSVVTEVQQQHALLVSLKKCQLLDIARRLRAGAAILRDRYCLERDGFASDLEELGRRWPVHEMKRTGASYVDDCVLVTVRFQVEDDWPWLDSDSLGKHTYVIARDQNEGADRACAVFQDLLLSGWREIDAQLRRLRSERAWKLIQAALEEEAVATDVGDAAAVSQTDVRRAVLALSRSSLSSLSLPGCIFREERMLYVEKFCRTETCRTLFRKRAVFALRTASKWCLIPSLILRTTPTRYASFMEQLCEWLSFSAMWYEVAESLPGDPCSGSIHDYITALASSTHCVPARVRLGSTCFSIDENYSMVTDRGVSVGRLQLKEMLGFRDVSIEINMN